LLQNWPVMNKKLTTPVFYQRLVKKDDQKKRNHVQHKQNKALRRFYQANIPTFSICYKPISKILRI